MKMRSQRGFTLIEVVLAIAVGLIIIAGVSVGYSYAKKAAIMDNQRKDVAAIKTYVETAITSIQAGLATGQGSMHPPYLTFAQMKSLAASLPSLKTDPYTGTDRTNLECDVSDINMPNTSQPCIGISSNFITSTGTNTPIAKSGTGSKVVYFYGRTIKTQFNVPLADGSVRNFKGYAIVETDSDGNMVAAEGGG